VRPKLHACINAYTCINALVLYFISSHAFFFFTERATIGSHYWTFRLHTPQMRRLLALKNALKSTPKNTSQPEKTRRAAAGHWEGGAGQGEGRGAGVRDGGEGGLARRGASEREPVDKEQRETVEKEQRERERERVEEGLSDRLQRTRLLQHGLEVEVDVWGSGSHGASKDRKLSLIDEAVLKDLTLPVSKAKLKNVKELEYRRLREP
jgi:hypothetical protein